MKSGRIIDNVVTCVRDETREEEGGKRNNQGKIGVNERMKEEEKEG